MAEKRRLNLALNLNLPLHRQAWEIIRKFPPGSRTEQICRMLCNNQNMRQEKLLNNIRQIVHEELQNLQISAVVEENIMLEPELQDVSDDVLGFLRALQEGDGIG